MRPFAIRLTLLAATAAMTVSCDSRLPVGPRGTGGAADVTDQTAPTITIEAPIAGDVIYLGDSVRVRIRATDDVGLRIISLVATGVRQLPGASTVDSVPYVATVAANINSLRQATVDGYVYPVVPTDPNIVRVVIKARAVDQNNNFTDARDVVVNVVIPPTVVVLEPLDQENRVRAGVPLPVRVRAESNVGLAWIGYRVQSEGALWTTPFSFRDSVAVAALSDTADLVINVPANAPPGGRMIIYGFARDLGGFLRESAPPVTVFIRTVTSRPPVVKQVVPARLEITDFIQVEVDGDSVTTVGAVISRTTGTPRDTVVSYPISALITGAPPHVTGPRTVSLGLNLGNTWQGRTVTIMAFATDLQGRTGYAVPQAVNAPETDSTRAQHSLSTVVFGRTFSLPVAGIAGDIAIDTVRGRAFVSNTQHNRLEVWSGATGAFIPSGVAVGSQPWGMALQMDGDTLLVANSGGTNISRVPILDATASTIRENIARRILTRNTLIYTVTTYRDDATRAIRWRVTGPISYSDRPQYVAQAASGRLYFSTKPTATSPAGTIRYLDPRQAAPDARTVYDYGAPSEASTFTVFNADFVVSTNRPANDPADDIITIGDHSTGTTAADGSISSGSNDIFLSRDGVNALGGDVEVAAVDAASLALSDTTFVTVSGNRNWVAFGEGNRGGAARVMLAFDNDPAVVRPYFSPGVAVKDLMDNASEPVFGLALDFTGSTLGVHGNESHFSRVELPFHLRLQGKYNSFDQGAGIAFHPYADGNNLGNADSRLAFIASANGQIEVVDIGYFINRGRLPIKGNFYGPLRVSAPFPGDAARGVVLKLFGLSDRGLVVIDLTQADILAGP